MNLISQIDEVIGLIKTGVLEKDWNLILDSYELLTGVRMDLPEEDADPIKEMMRRLEQLEKDRAVVQKTPKEKPAKPIKTPRAKKETNSRPNKFEEMMGEISSEAAKESGFDKINDRVPPTPRTRKPYTPVTLTCTRCGKTEQVNPMFKKDDYRCNNCIGK